MSRTLHLSPITENQILAAGEVLARAFLPDPLCVYTQPDLKARMSQFTWLFTQLVRNGARQHGVYVSVRTDQPDGVAVWTPPESERRTEEDAEASGMDRMEQRFGPQAYHRFTTTYSYFEDIHHQCMPRAHWYLALLGVSPDCQGQGIGRALLTPVLEKADRHGLPCYLETFVPENLPFYERRGFHVVDGGIEPQSEVAFWAMKREPNDGE